MSDNIYMKSTLHQRLWARVEKLPEGCWIWQGNVQRKGYGTISEGGQGTRKSFLVHRLAYTLLKGPIPMDMTLDHLCRNHRCVNPDHLEVVTHKVNILRGDGVAGINARKTQCINGHPFDEVNTHIRSTGRRMCRACGRMPFRIRYDR